MSFQVPNGVVDILVKDDEEAIETTKKYLSYFQGPVQRWDFRDQRGLRHIIPENRTETYDMRAVIQTLADEDSILEIREAFGVGIITAFIRVEGRPLGLIANNPQHLSGAIDSDAADKGARFLQLCDTFDIPVLSLMDCPGIMPGPEYERAALLRHCGRLFVTGANMTTPMFGVVLRKAYGMGVRAMCGGSSLEPFFTVAWPTAEFADMTIDGRVKLMFGEELDALENADERQAIFERLLAAHVDRIRAVGRRTPAIGRLIDLDQNPIVAAGPDAGIGEGREGRAAAGRQSNPGRQFRRYQLRGRRRHRSRGYARLDRPGTAERSDAPAGPPPLGGRWKSEEASQHRYLVADMQARGDP